jgi:hypothetical protein
MKSGKKMQRLSSLRQEHQAQINSVNVQHEEDCQKLQDELELQKSKVVILEAFCSEGCDWKLC